MHQHLSGLLPAALAFSMAQTLGSLQMGQRVGSMVFIYIFVMYVNHKNYPTQWWVFFRVNSAGGYENILTN
jgi:hypothetical protein